MREFLFFVGMICTILAAFAVNPALGFAVVGVWALIVAVASNED